MHISMYWNLLYFCSDIWIICVHFEFGLRCSHWVIFMVVYTHEITCFRGGVLSRNNIFCLWYSHKINFTRVTHEIPNSHEIHFMMATPTKYRTLMKSVHDGDLLRNSTKYPPRKHWCKPGGNVIFMRVAVTELSWKWDFCVYYRKSWCVTVYPHALFS